VERVGLHQRAALGIEKIREHVRRRRQCRGGGEGLANSMHGGGGW
jgi:hypothetical protein